MDEAELLEKLAYLEDRIKESDAENQKKQFFDKYGVRFKGHEGVGAAILAGLNKRGIDTSAADEAVEEIIKEIQDEVIEAMDKLRAIEDAIKEANGQGEEETPELEQPPEPEEPEPAPEEPAPAPEASATPEASPAPAPAPEAGVPSDIKLKDIKSEEINNDDINDAFEDEINTEFTDEDTDEDDIDNIPMEGYAKEEIEFDPDTLDESDFITKLLMEANRHRG